MTMQLENTVEGWAGVLADLANKRQAAEENVERLRSEKRTLAPEAAMGGANAKKRLREVNEQLAREAFALDDLGVALERATAEKQKAATTEAAAAEAERRRQIAVQLQEYAATVELLDGHMQQLAAWFKTAKESLDRAEALMTGSERQPIQQLRSVWGPTLAAAHFGLDRSIELCPRGGADLVQHRQPLARFIEPFVSAWIGPPAANGKE